MDPSGVRKPVNLTKGYGEKNKVRFRYLPFNRGYGDPITAKDTLLFLAINEATKESGFFHLVMGIGKLEKLEMSPHIYLCPPDDYIPGEQFSSQILKAKNTNVYLLSRMSSSEYPNLYVTEDFCIFRSLTELAPQKEFNWYTTELIHWTLSDGQSDEGILFKPENFDSKKKYPIIFFYYQQFAFNLNAYIYPELTTGAINIPFFVSNGYLVFVPDIHYKIGHPGQSACDAVVSAARFLAQKPWIDPKHMGLQGHSYGGFETNYIVSHSNMFAAAAPASGVCDQVSGYGDGASFYERTQGRIGYTLWQRPDLYLENSTIFSANKISTPILIMHTTNDGVCPYRTQGLQWYNEIYRLHKKAWLLTYDGENHTLRKDKNRLDYSIRLKQFFDHYLKGSPAPIWMTRGVLAGEEITKGLELDTSGRQP